MILVMLVNPENFCDGFRFTWGLEGAFGLAIAFAETMKDRYELRSLEWNRWRLVSWILSAAALLALALWVYPIIYGGSVCAWW